MTRPDKHELYRKYCKALSEAQEREENAKRFDPDSDFYKSWMKLAENAKMRAEWHKKDLERYDKERGKNKETWKLIDRVYARIRSRRKALRK